MIDPKISLTAWLNQEPHEQDLSYNEDGTAYQSIDVIKSKLDIYCPGWDTKNFNHSFFLSPWGTFYCSGSLELILDYDKIPPYRIVLGQSFPEKDVKALLEVFNKQPLQIVQAEQAYTNKSRTIVGASTFNTEKYFSPPNKDKLNEHFAAICSSLCIVNAAQNIAPFFGKNLNKKIQQESESTHDKIQATFNKVSGQ